MYNENSDNVRYSESKIKSKALIDFNTITYLEYTIHTKLLNIFPKPMSEPNQFSE